jgi:phenylpropionate dioxygenase-like ring-hydroxylating dioxygenase large terminal subunit
MGVLPEKRGPRIPDTRPPYPNGWQSIGFSDEVKPGQVVSRHVLGQDLVLFRGNSGTLSVVDAYCPHLGAHLGCGGKVVGDNLRCPYHYWEFSVDGKCSAMPYGTIKPKKAVLKTQLVREINGFIFVWHDAKGRDPTWEIPYHPITDSPDHYLAGRGEHVFKGHPQDISENGADFGHFVAVHHWDNVKLQFLPEGHAYRLAMESVGAGNLDGNGTADEAASRTVGPGYTYTHYKRDADWLVMACTTPVEPGLVYLHYSYYVHRSVPRPQGKALADELTEAWDGDILIWDNKCYREHPILNNKDGPIGQFRRWYQQFYD